MSFEAREAFASRLLESERESMTKRSDLTGSLRVMYSYLKGARAHPKPWQSYWKTPGLSVKSSINRSIPISSYLAIRLPTIDSYFLFLWLVIWLGFDPRNPRMFILSIADSNGYSWKTLRALGSYTIKMAGSYLPLLFRFLYINGNKLST